MVWAPFFFFVFPFFFSNHDSPGRLNLTHVLAPFLSAHIIVLIRLTMYFRWCTPFWTSGMPRLVVL